MSVYFIEDTVTGFVKIGYSGNVKSRMASLQTATAHKLKLLHSMEGELRDEHRIHRELKRHCVRGEWFEGQAAKAYIRQVSTRYRRARMIDVFGLDNGGAPDSVVDFRDEGMRSGGALWRIEGSYVTRTRERTSKDRAFSIYVLTNNETSVPDCWRAFEFEWSQMWAAPAGHPAAVDQAIPYRVNSIERIEWEPHIDDDGDLWAFYSEYLVCCESELAWLVKHQQEVEYHYLLDLIEGSAEATEREYYKLLDHIQLSSEETEWNYQDLLEWADNSSVYFSDSQEVEFALISKEGDS